MTTLFYLYKCPITEKVQADLVSIILGGRRVSECRDTYGVIHKKFHSKSKRLSLQLEKE